MRRTFVVLAAALLFVAAAARDTEAIVIEFQALNVADDMPGEDRWEYRYFVSDVDFDADQGFSVVFDHLLFSDLALLSAPSADWDAIDIQPDPTLQSDGLYDALALVDGASPLAPFAVAFTWLGSPGTAPGSQSFTLNQFDSGGNLTVLEEGQTIPFGDTQSVPEPSTLLLVALGGAGLLGARARRREKT
jgi:hypothetical protein